MQWYDRETFTATLCANLPRLAPLFSWVAEARRRRCEAIAKSKSGYQAQPSPDNREALAVVSLAPSDSKMSDSGDPHYKEGVISKSSDCLDKVHDIEMQQRSYR